MDVVQLTSLYGKDKNPGEFVRTSDILYLDPDKKRTETWLQGLGVQFPSDVTTLGSIGSITYQDGKVKIEGVPIFQRGASVDAKTGTSAPGDTTTSALAPKIKNQESATSVNRVLELVRQATAMAEGEHGTPDWVPQKIRDALKPLTDLNLAAAKRKALGDLLGLSPELQKNIPIALDKILADADDIARWESLELSPDLQEFIQPQLEEKKNDLQWLEERLEKLEEPGEEPSKQEQDEELTKDTADGILSKDYGGREFQSEELFSEHHEKHGEEFGGISEFDYLTRAIELVDSPLSDDVVALTRSDGSVAKYRFSTNEFVVINADGTIRTFFKPKDGKEYWQDELDRNR